MYNPMAQLRCYDLRRGQVLANAALFMSDLRLGRLGPQRFSAHGVIGTAKAAKKTWARSHSMDVSVCLKVCHGSPSPLAQWTIKKTQWFLSL